MKLRLYFLYFSFFLIVVKTPRIQLFVMLGFNQQIFNEIVQFAHQIRNCRNKLFFGNIYWNNVFVFEINGCI